MEVQRPSIPQTLQETWKKVSNDGTISKDDYVQLLKAAAPNSDDAELDKDEEKFLVNLRNEFESSGGEGLAVKSLGFLDDSSKTESKLKVPETLKEAWKAVSADGSISTDDYVKLLTAAAPNQKDSELDDSEKDFLVNLRENLVNNNGNSVPLSKISFVDDIAEKAKTFKLPEVPETLKGNWDRYAKDGKVDVKDYEKLLNAAAPNKENEEFDEKEIQFLSKLKDALADNNGSIDVKNIEFHKSGPKVPDTLEKAWKEITKDGTISKDDFNTLLEAASPNRKDDELDVAEINFLKNISDVLINSDEPVKVEGLKF